MARCGCSDTGASSVRSLLSADNGVQYNSLTGHFMADISTNPGNNLTLDGSGKLFVPTGSATVTTGPGILGDGSGPNPVRANVAAWPYPTAPVTGSQGVFVHPGTGQLVSPPIQVADLVSVNYDRTYANLPASSSGTPVVADTFIINLANPDPNRPCLVFIQREVKVRFTMPAGSSVGSSQGIPGTMDETARYHNPGTASISNVGILTTKLQKNTSLAAGAVSSFTLSVGTENAVGAVTYSRIEVNLRALYIAQ